MNCCTLRWQGPIIREARNGYECLAMAQEQQPDLIMIDLWMPKLDGWGVLKELKSAGRTAKIPCVAVTTYADTDRERPLRIGFSAFLSKPFRGREMFETVRTFGRYPILCGKGLG